MLVNFKHARSSSLNKRGDVSLMGVTNHVRPGSCMNKEKTMMMTTMKVWILSLTAVSPDPTFLCVCAQEMVIGGLKPDTTYSITVAAYTTKGDGARSKPKLVVTKGAGQ